VLIGRFHLGRLIRYIPYPVIGGFLAAVGWILLQGAFSLLVDYSFSISTLGDLFEYDTLIRWLPAMVFGVGMFVITRAKSHYLIIPSLLIGGIVLFFVVILAAGETIKEVEADGWMLGPFEHDSSWNPLFLEDFDDVNWDLILHEAGHIPTIALVSAIALLLNISGLEVQSDDDIEIKKELQVTGLANIALGLGGGFVGFHTLSITLLGWRMQGKGRALGVLFGVICLLALIFGFSLIAYFPKYVLGGLLIFLGIDVLTDWFWDGYFKMSKQDYVIMILILLTVAIVGYLQGVGLGILGAAVLFTFNYSRVDTVKQTLTGATYHSNVDRPITHYRRLHEIGGRLLIYRLNGVIFFGSASRLLDLVVARLEDQDQEELSYLILDFHHVQGVDSSSILSFIRLNQLLHRNDVTFIFAEMDETTHEVFNRSDFDLNDRSHFRHFAWLDEAVEWCENRLLRESAVTAFIPGTIKQQLELNFPEFKYFDDMVLYMERAHFAEGEVIAKQGDDASSLFWVEEGRLQARLEAAGVEHRVRTVTTGAIIGEIGLYSQKVRSASIIADEPSVLYVLTRESLLRMEKEDPIVAAAFHKMITLILAERLADTTDSLMHFLE
jgi:SulP family sulfate permease